MQKVASRLSEMTAKNKKKNKNEFIRRALTEGSFEFIRRVFEVIRRNIRVYSAHSSSLFGDSSLFGGLFGATGTPQEKSQSADKFIHNAELAWPDNFVFVVLKAFFSWFSIQVFVFGRFFDD